MNHIPGPWIYRPDQYADWGEVRGPDDYIVTRVSVCRHTKEELTEHRINGTDPEEATARLIAAAPDLYAACEAALGAFENNNAIDWDILSDALKKARGEAC